MTGKESCKWQSFGEGLAIDDDDKDDDNEYRKSKLNDEYLL